MLHDEHLLKKQDLAINPSQSSASRRVSKTGSESFASHRRFLKIRRNLMSAERNFENDGAMVMRDGSIVSKSSVKNTRNILSPRRMH